jgi:hypothetical protein
MADNCCAECHVLFIMRNVVMQSFVTPLITINAAHLCEFTAFINFTVNLPCSIGFLLVSLAVKVRNFKPKRAKVRKF